MRKAINIFISVSIVLFIFSCSGKQAEENNQIDIQSQESRMAIMERFGTDSLAQAIFQENIDTVNGRWIFKLSEQEAIAKGFRKEFYLMLMSDLKIANAHIDSMIKNNPEERIDFQFPAPDK